jgi:putative transposase
MASTQIWIHLVWGTKRREPLLQKSVRFEIFEHIRETARAKDIHVDFINGHVDHVHCLISMGASQNIADIAKQLKGESSHWANNKTSLLKHKLEWCEGYYAVSIGVSSLEAVREYIKNQEEHHRKKSFAEECEEFMRIYGFGAVLE